MSPYPGRLVRAAELNTRTTVPAQKWQLVLGETWTFFPSQFEGEGWLFEQPKTHLVFYCFLCSGSCVSGQCFLYCSVIWVRGWMRIWELYLAFQRSKKNTASDFKNKAWARLQPSFNDERIMWLVELSKISTYSVFFLSPQLGVSGRKKNCC